MYCSLIVSLLLAHFVGDFVLQTDSFCSQKRERKTMSWFLYAHALIISILSWIAIWDWRLWFVALAIGISHLLIDLGKAYAKQDTVWVFIIDQLLHILILVIAAWICIQHLGCAEPDWLTPTVMKAEAIVLASIICWKPANLLIKEILQYNSMFVPAADSSSFHAGKLIGTLERWLILAFILLGRYEVIGFLIAAKSIIRFGEHDRNETEYFLAGTLLSIAIAVGCGLMLKMVW